MEDAMNCPKCDSPMEKITFRDIEVDRCTKCKGLWFDILEQEDLKDIEGSEEIDIGDTKTGRKYNKIEKINCPVCKSTMIRMVDKDQPHIWFESCSGCYGAFFDAGEFRDYKEKNILDFFRDLITRERK
jgi:Zn-finger nucleic acid-binding protein